MLVGISVHICDTVTGEILVQKCGETDIDNPLDVVHLKVTFEQYLKLLRKNKRLSLEFIGYETPQQLSIPF